MIKSPLVSIIIPLYNAEDFIEETLESCLQQTFDNIEIIVVDDHSTDGSIQKVRSFHAKHPDKIYIFKNLGKGACAARNFGFEASSGNYIQYLDADDLLNPEKIESQMRVLSGNQKNTIAHCQWGRFSGDLIETNWKEQKINKNYENPVEWLVDSWSGKGMGTIHSWLIPRDIIQNIEPWNEKLKINQDGEFFSRVLLNSSAIIFSEEAKVYYRSGNPLSISQNNSRDKVKASSLLYSYQLYKENILNYYDSEEIRIALGNNYLNFIYQFNDLFPDLSEKAKQNFNDLGFKKMWPVGGYKFRKMANILGFKRSLLVKSYSAKWRN